MLLDPCVDEPLAHLVWDDATRAVAAAPGTVGTARGHATIQLFLLDQEPIREERRVKYQTVLFLLARILDEEPPHPQTRLRLRDELLPHRPWLGPIRQLFLRSEDPIRTLGDQAQAKMPEIRDWIEPWI